MTRFPFDFPRALGPAARGSLLLLTSWFIGTAPLGAQEGIRLNEVMASNGATIADAEGDYEDWIELHNAGDVTVSLSGWGLSDDPVDPFRWRFPDVVLEPGEFLLVWASGKDRSDPGSPLHANFSLSASGEALLLTFPWGSRADEFPPTELLRDISAGRRPDGTDAWVFFDEPTPGAGNTTTGYKEILPEPAFSHSGGFYPAPFSLSLTAARGATILYTLDGSEPDPENIGGATYEYKNAYAFGPLLERPFETRVFNGAIDITDRTGGPNPLYEINTLFTGSTSLPPGPVYRGVPVRARAFRDGALPSRTETHSYFIHPGTEPRYDLMVVSVTTDEPHLFDYETGIYVPGKIAVDWREENPNTNFDGSSPANFQGRGIEWERPGHLEVFETGGERVLSQGIGLRLHGGWSRQFAPRKSLRLYAKSDYDSDNVLKYPIFPDRVRSGEGGGTLNAFRRLILRNSGNDQASTLFRDAAMQEMVRHLPLDTQGYRPVVHFINGEYWGIINIRERYDRHYVAGHYGVDPEDVAILDYSPVVSPEYAGLPMPNLGVGTGTLSDREDYLEMHDYAVAADLSDPEAFAHLETLMDVDNFALYHAVQIYIGNDDWPQNNLDFWRKRTDTYRPDAPYGHDGRWRWMLYDLDFGFNSGAVGRNSLARIVDNANVGGFAPVPWANELVQNLLENDGFRHDFINTLNDLSKSVFHPDRVNSILNELAANLESSRTEHWFRWGSGTNRGDFMRDFAAERGERVRSHIRNVFGLPGTANVTVANPGNPGGRVRINGLPIDDSVPGIREAPLIEAPLAEAGTIWRYLDGGAEPGSFWRNPGFDDAGWNEGPGSFGYGLPAGEFVTEIDSGDDPADRPITTYFRKTFEWEESGIPGNLILSANTEGGAVFYLNGTEIVRHRMPAGPIDSTTPAETGGGDPGALDGIAAWFAADGDVVTRSSGGDRFVTTWTNLSGGGDHAVQNTTFRQPRLVSDAIGNKPAVRFDGSGDFLEMPIGDWRNGLTLFMVARLNDAGPDYGSYAGLNGAGSGNVFYHVGSGVGRSRGLGLGIAQPGGNLGDINSQSEEFELIRIDADADYRHRITRVRSGQSVSGNLSNLTGAVDNLTLAASREAGEFISNHLPMDIAEVVIFNRELDGAEIGKVESYLADKYGFEIPASIRYEVDADALTAGSNVLAVEVHQESASAERFHFDASLRVSYREELPTWSGLYFRDVPIDVEAIPEPGYRFTGWEGLDVTEASHKLELAGDVQLEPRFEFDEDLLRELTPPPHSLASGDYAFDAWDSAAPAGTYPSNMVFEQASLADPDLVAELDGHWVLPYDLDSRSRINGLGDGGVAFVNTTNVQEHSDAGYLGSAILGLDTRETGDIRVTWTGGTVVPNERAYAIRLQHRIGDDGPFIDAADDEGVPVEYLRRDSAGHSETFGPVRLPGELEGRPYVQLRWKYYYVDGDSGPRAQLRLDDIAVTATRTNAGGETYDDWVEAHFPDPGDPALTAPDADPRGEGVPNLLRYALDLGANEPAATRLPRIESADGRLSLVFRRSSGKEDLAYVVQATSDLEDWGETLYDSRTDPVPQTEGDEVRISDRVTFEEADGRRFLRLKIVRVP